MSMMSPAASRNGGDKRRAGAELGLLDIGERRRRGGDLDAGEGAETIEAGDAEIGGEALAGRGAVEEGGRERRHRGG